MKFDKEQLGLHAPSFGLAAIGTILLISWYGLASSRAESWVGGGSPAGLGCGIAAALVIAFEMLLWPRKYFRRLRLVPAKYWMSAHIWLGLASLPLAIVHTGFHLGGPLPTTLMILFGVVIASGIYGVALQQLIPRILLKFLPAETIYSQIDHVSAQNVADARTTLLATCGPRSVDVQSVEPEPAVPQRPSVVVGAVRELGLAKGRTIRTQTIVTSTRDREILWRAFDEISPFLQTGVKAGGLFASRSEALRWFGSLRRACGDSSEPAIATMEQFYEQRRQFDMQRRLHQWLHCWLPVHIGFSVAVTVLLVIHILTALQYW